MKFNEAEINQAAAAARLSNTRFLQLWPFFLTTTRAAGVRSFSIRLVLWRLQGSVSIYWMDS